MYAQRLARAFYGGPAAGAEPIAPFPWIMAFRWALIPAFAGYALTGNVRDPQVALAAMLPALIAYTAFLHWRFKRAAADPARLLRTWAWALAVDIAIVMGAQGFDATEVSPISLLAVALLAQAVAMFRPRYVVALAVLAAPVLVISDLIGDIVADDMAPAASAWEAAVTLMVGAFLAYLCAQVGRGRERLLAAEQEAVEQTAIVQDALATAAVSQGRFEAIAGNAPALIALFDSSANILYVNRRLVEVTGVRADAFPGNDLASGFMPAESYAAALEAVNQAVRGRVSQVEFGLRTAGSGLRTHLGVFFPVGDGAGAVAIDVTDERAMREQIVRMDQVQMLGTLAGGIAHDFNNLLSVILGNLYLIDLDLSAESPLRELTAGAREAGEGGAQLVRQLADYSRPHPDPFETVDMAEVIDSTLKLARTALRGMEVELVPCGHRVLVRGQHGALQQVFLNLIMNSRDALAGSGRLVLSCRHEASPGPTDAPGAWKIRVEDNGSGIAPADLKRIFDPFYTTKDPGKGTGLGLAMVDMIIRNHGGSIAVESNPGRTVFTITLPAAPPPGEMPATGEERAPAHAGEVPVD